MKKTVLYNKNIVLGVCGGIAAYKSVELLRRLVKLGARVRVIMTRSATRFVGPMTFEVLSENPVCLDLFEEKDDAAIRHIAWAEAAHGVVIAPATANMVAKLTHGIADDALSTFMLAVTCPVMICPSMNSNMFEHPATQRNLSRLKADGCRILAPGEGELACGTTGPGRLPEPEAMVDRLISFLSPDDLAGKNVLVTAGPTREAIDPVRFISNPSSGKMGYAIARAAENRGARVTLVTGPVALAPPLNVEVVPVVTVDDMAQAVFSRLEQSHVVVKVAAVSDYRPVKTETHKIKKGEGGVQLALERTTDILKTVGQRKSHQIVVGFAAETRDMENHARKKLEEKRMDMIAANLIGPPDSGFASDTNRMTLFFADGRKEDLEVMDKDAVAHLILDRVAELVKQRAIP
ncbi:MAG: bifunctional phosphopantothenoylcysteine decarboxylase/phosphopantothenate--cysteine ligase CoaBC [Desulfosarcina sp.]|nr:bifunctional phosphopantothenoylcysteine decarboxylase/phosphopantothenate--cysteine ligase CoaBC [Desulfosarcina sp.]MBC2742766.1 bifunctional phosphopantothenoylcysteine decarboxylase/phosphopantothenate--cysteine ligase CoaBC [Desulfosarcina sp.]MBC2765676.1 bifunctional phosphopantothenoylcysteine decarboxylase/phosphopantothenate--cysteine ligase CoaBC [Desulfosarcina sp.]